MENQWEFFDVSSNHQVVQMSCRRVKQLNDSSAAWGSLMFFDMIKECKFIVVGFAAEWLFTSVSTSKYVSSNHQAVNISCHSRECFLSQVVQLNDASPAWVLWCSFKWLTSVNFLCVNCLAKIWHVWNPDLISKSCQMGQISCDILPDIRFLKVSEIGNGNGVAFWYKVWLKQNFDWLD